LEIVLYGKPGVISFRLERPAYSDDSLPVCHYG
jgi:hypothetical protein